MTYAMPADQTVPNPSGYHANAPKPGRLRADGLADSERNFGVFTHLSSFLGLAFAPLILAPLIFWLARKDISPFNDDHGRESVNFVFSFILWHFILGITVIGIILFPVLWIVGFVNVIRGAIAAGNGEYFRYPVTIRFLK